MNLIAFLVVGVSASLFSFMVFKQSRGFLLTLFLGIMGAFLGGACSTLFQSSTDWMTFTSSGLMWSAACALMVLAIAAVNSDRSLAAIAVR